MANKAETCRSAHDQNINKNIYQFVQKCLGISDFRKVSRLIEKVCNKKWAIVFNKACLKEHLVPNYLKNIYIYIIHSLSPLFFYAL